MKPCSVSTSLARSSKRLVMAMMALRSLARHWPSANSPRCSKVLQWPTHDCQSVQLIDKRNLAAQALFDRRSAPAQPRTRAAPAAVTTVPHVWHIETLQCPYSGHSSRFCSETAPVVSSGRGERGGRPADRGLFGVLEGCRLARRPPTVETLMALIGTRCAVIWRQRR